MTTRLMRCAGLVAVALFMSSCAVMRVDAPWSFTPDHRLEMLSPENDDELSLPVTIDWEASGIDVSDGSRFVVYLDRIPLQPDKELRMKVCTKGDSRPPAPGELRTVCEPDSDSVFVTSETELTLECLEPRENVADRIENQHEVRVIVLGPDGRRDGTAVASVRFEVIEDDALSECIGFGADF